MRARDTNYRFIFLMLMVWCVRLRLFDVFRDRDQKGKSVID